MLMDRSRPEPQRGVQPGCASRGSCAGGHSARRRPLLCGAIAKANVYGHASFGRGELRKILANGKGRPVAENTLKDNMHKLVSGQAIAPYSTPLCMVLASNTFRRGGRATRAGMTSSLSSAMAEVRHLLNLASDVAERVIMT
jgi:hypothetical protein